MPDPGSTLAELSTLTARLDELTKRVTDLAEAYRTTPDSRISSALFAAERSLHAAGRALERATEQVRD